MFFSVSIGSMLDCTVPFITSRLVGVILVWCRTWVQVLGAPLRMTLTCLNSGVRFEVVTPCLRLSMLFPATSYR